MGKSTKILPVQQGDLPLGIRTNAMAQDFNSQLTELGGTGLKADEEQSLVTRLVSARLSSSNPGGLVVGVGGGGGEKGFRAISVILAATRIRS